VHLATLADVVNAWVLDPRAHGPAHSEALQRLLQMNLLLQGSTQASSVAAQAQPAYQLHPTFQSKLQWALSTGWVRESGWASVCGIQKWTAGHSGKRLYNTGALADQELWLTHS
jgi:hypothetical protein